MTAFCKTHVKDRSYTELVNRYKELTSMTKLGPRYKQEMKNIQAELQKRKDNGVG